MQDDLHQVPRPGIIPADVIIKRIGDLKYRPVIDIRPQCGERGGVAEKRGDVFQAPDSVVFEEKMAAVKMVLMAIVV